MAKYFCDNCDWEGDELGKELWEIHRLCERLDEGGIVPAGECPECSCFAYLDDDQYRQRVYAKDMIDLIRRLGVAFYVKGTAKALKPVMAEIKPLLDKVNGRN